MKQNSIKEMSHPIFLEADIYITRQNRIKLGNSTIRYPNYYIDTKINNSNNNNGKIMAREQCVQKL